MVEFVCFDHILAAAVVVVELVHKPAVGVEPVFVADNYWDQD